MTRILLLLSIVLAGCETLTLSAITVPPPGKTAHLDDEDDTIDISRGVALGFDCLANEDGYNGPCRDPRVSVADDTVAAIYTSYSDALAESYNYGHAGARGRTSFVVVGLREGKTEVFITTKDGGISLDVNVKP
ncbi:MAG: hypothetical protein H0T46_31420 [Deltaproteobacteria bacterium]|nr:hypothetical protein [Deltaproteobacteria bacterium]